MAKSSKSAVGQVPLSQPKPWSDFAEVAPSYPIQIHRLKVGQTQLASFPVTQVRLDMENLQCFEPVDHQFKRWEVIFNNAIAIRPSNPAYPAYSGVMVLMGAPRSGYLEVSFLRPAHFVSGFVTSSRRTVLTAFDRNNQAIAHTETAGANLAGGDHSPNLQLNLRAADIHRVTFHAFDGQLTLDDFCFCLDREAKQNA